MKTWLVAAAIALAAGALVPAAQAQEPQTEGPRPSSLNNWPGIRDLPPAATETPHYVWQEGYTHHGRWLGHWVLVP